MKDPKFDVYPAKDGYRWRLLAANGRIIAESGEAYVSRSGAVRAKDTVVRTISCIASRMAAARFVGGPAAVSADKLN